MKTWVVILTNNFLRIRFLFLLLVSVLMEVVGLQVELPVEADGFTVRRDGQLVVVTGEGGVMLRCNVVAGLCSLELPGWFHGRVTGFAGSLDRELGNDVMNPQEDDFQQWKVRTQLGVYRDAS